MPYRIHICRCMDTTMAGGTARELISRFDSLGDESRLRILTLLDRNEFTVSELVSVLQLPQSTVSRHRKVLADDGWVRRRQDGKTRYYRLESELEADARELWRLTAESLSAASWIAEDAERAESVLAARHERAAAFFSETAGGWDALRNDLFGRDARFAPPWCRDRYTPGRRWSCGVQVVLRFLGHRRPLLRLGIRTPRPLEVTFPRAPRRSRAYWNIPSRCTIAIARSKRALPSSVTESRCGGLSKCTGPS